MFDTQSYAGVAKLNLTACDKAMTGVGTGNKRSNFWDSLVLDERSSINFLGQGLKCM